MRHSKEIVEVDVTVVNHTALALLVDDGSKSVWVPLSRIEDWSPDTDNFSEIESIFIPEWLAIEKGLV